MPLHKLPLLEVASILHSELVKKFNIDRPKILVCGLNPHAGENGHLGSEEIETIIPVIKTLQRQGLDFEGPLPADTAVYTQQPGPGRCGTGDVSRPGLTRAEVRNIWTGCQHNAWACRLSVHPLITAPLLILPDPGVRTARAWWPQFAVLPNSAPDGIARKKKIWAEFPGR